MNKLALAAIAVFASAASAQEPSTAPDNVNARVRITIDPNADTPDDILRKIAGAKLKVSGASSEAPAKDLHKVDVSTDRGAPDPGTRADPGAPGPTTPPSI